MTFLLTVRQAHATILAGPASRQVVRAALPWSDWMMPFLVCELWWFVLVICKREVGLNLLVVLIWFSSITLIPDLGEGVVCDLLSFLCCL